jgi:1,4-dihydroxy-6-naphthoate synthase
VTTTIRLAFSPDSDDIFMFWPLLAGHVGSSGYCFVAERADTETLNARADREDVDVLAVSVARYASIADRYLLLRQGMSVGRGYGPVVVAKQPVALDHLRGRRVAVPGLRTTALLTLRLLLDEFDPVVVPIQPYRAVFDALDAGTVDAALLIHEGRLTYEQEGFAKVLDVGEAFAERTGGLPLPLGANVIRRGLGPVTVGELASLCRDSVEWALAHRDTVMDAILAEGHPGGAPVSRALLDRYLAMYANEDTRHAPPDVEAGLRELFRRAEERALLKPTGPVEFAVPTVAPGQRYSGREG